MKAKKQGFEFFAIFCKHESPVPSDFKITAGEKATLQFGTNELWQRIEIGDVKYFKRDVQNKMMMSHFVETESEWVTVLLR